MTKFLGKLLSIALLTVMTACSEGGQTQVIKIALDEQNSKICCYTAVLPASRSIEMYMVLIPGFGETEENVLAATDLPYVAAEVGIAVFIPMLQNGAESYSFSSESQQCLRTLVGDMQSRFDLSQKDYCIGGFSMGGSAAVRYAELSSDNSPVCVFAIDSPLDYERFRSSTERDVYVYRKGLADGDSIYVRLLNDITPLIDDSPYFLSDTTHQAIAPLKNIPLRYYIEPAEQWWLDNRQTDAYGLNILDATAFINDLRLIGNDSAELIVTHEKGFRNNGTIYHPHSWTIVDADELVEWIARCREDSLRE